MTTYAGIRSGWVTDIVTPPSDCAVPVEKLFAPGLVDQWIRIDGIEPPPAYGWRYASGTFTAPSGPDDAVAMHEAMMARRMAQKVNVAVSTPTR